MREVRVDEFREEWVLATADSSNRRQEGRAPRYVMIQETLRKAIQAQRLPSNQILLEGPIARLFGTSRGPVRKALELLHEQGLISRFEGRGFLATPDPESVKPVRDPLTPEMLGLGGDERPVVDTRSAADRIYVQVEEAVATCLAFGHFRIIETVLSEYHGVSRTVAREVLGRLRNQRLIEKDRHSHWLAGPLTAQAVADDYEIRVLLEPAALKVSGPLLDRAELEAMRDEVQRLIDHPELQNAAAITRLEQDLHQRCLRLYPNRKAREMIAQSQLPVIVNRIFFQTLGVPPDEPLLMEHKLVLDHLLFGAFDAAASSLQSHLQAAAERSRRRLKVLSVFPEPSLPPYLLKIT
ncbi:GntR family transcriptional regulator [Chromohalobacter israelensis]|uniref:GntR family transcriptional regulator n=1 Tax=Chromohalobacter israelensis TaxID=141390 RepID=UPI001CC7B276|nr:GntR family transcriptional regulator [Chromohalobacter salexigens]MBZ5875505.1 GntR family transcriptional regulator [Chromohalobacter salexigens]